MDYVVSTYYVVVKGFGREVCDYYTATSDEEARQKAMERTGISIEIKSRKPLAQDEPPYIERNVPDGNRHA